jgi:hypothetical protein
MGQGVGGYLLKAFSPELPTPSSRLRYRPPSGVGLRQWVDGSWLVSGVGDDDWCGWLSLDERGLFVARGDELEEERLTHYLQRHPG